MSEWTTALRIQMTNSGKWIVIPYEASRGIKQTLRPIDGGTEMRRSVNGNLIVVANPRFRKYATEITCSDYDVPAFGDLWVGDRITIESVVPIQQRVVGGTVSLKRLPVENSVEAFDSEGDPVEIYRISGDFDSHTDYEADGAVRVRYRPALSCVVTAVSWDYGEIADASWSLSAEEA